MFLVFRASVEEALTDALAALDHEAPDLGIEEPPADVDAVLASSVAFQLAGTTNDPPPAIAAAIADTIIPSDYQYVETVDAHGPYVNFNPSQSYYEAILHAGLDPAYGRLEPRDTHVIVEHTSANPTGPIHVGRARNPILGDALARLLTSAGYTVTTQYYVNDAGRQVAMFTWAYETFDDTDLPPPERDQPDYDLVRYYRKAAAFLESADGSAVEQAETEIQRIMQGLETADPATLDRVTRVVDRVLDGMQTSLARLPIEFDDFVKETDFIRDGSVNDVVRRLETLPEATQDDGAWLLDLSNAEITEPLVFTRSDGTSLYVTRDLAYHEWKLDHADRVVTVLGEDHKLQADQLRASLDLLGAEADRIEQVFYSWVNLPEGGMSTRAGTGVALDDLLDEAIDRARHEVESRLGTRLRDDQLTEADITRIARQVGVGAVRYDIVSTQPTKGITFQWEEALNFEAQSAPYVQYVHARCCGILTDTQPPEDPTTAVLTRPEERRLLRVIGRFPAVVNDAADALQPHQVATYTREIAEAFNAFYRECPVLAADDPDLRTARLTLVRGARHTVANALHILGVEAPTSM